MSTSPWAGPVAWILALAAGLLVLQPPSIPESPQPGDFSTERALQDLAWIAAQPHPTGSAENRAVRDALVLHLEALSLKPAVIEDAVLLPWGNERLRGARVANILTRIPGTDRTGTVLLAAHYDSVPTGAGAGDDAAAVAAMLEVARLLVAEPVRNDVLLLLSDAEELGLLGAQAFVRDSALVNEIDVVVNYEGRGGGGPSLLFETSDDNAWLIDEFATAPHPAGNSMAYEVYRRLPNDTDFSVFRRAGMEGLNFGFIDRFPHYHAAIDTPELLDSRSLQHHGEGMLSLARALGERDFGAEKGSGNAVFFNIPGMMVRYPGGLALPLALLASLVAVVRMRRSAVAGAVSALVSVMLAGGVGLGLALLLQRFHPGMSQLTLPTLYDDLPWRVAIAAISLLTVAGFRSATLRWSDLEGMWAGSRLLWALLAIGCAVEAPGASYLFTWPLLAAAVVPLRWAGVAGAVAVFFCVPTADQLLIALGLHGAPVSGVLYGLVGLLLVVERPRSLAASSAAVFIFSAVLGVLPSTPDEETPTHESLVFLQEPDGAWWLAKSESDWNRALLDGATTQLHQGDRSVHLLGDLLQAPAERQGIAPPIFRIRSDITTAERRWVRGTVLGKRGGCSLTIRIEDTARLTSLTLDGQPISLVGGPLTLHYFAPLRTGVPMGLEIEGAAPLTVHISEETFTLPDTVVRSTGSIPVPWGFGTTDATIVTAKLSL